VSGFLKLTPLRVRSPFLQLARSDGRLEAAKERFTPTEVELLTHASSPTGGMNPQGHTGHIVFAASTTQPSTATARTSSADYFELQTIESTGAQGERWPSSVRAGVMARAREFQRMGDGSWRIPADAASHAGAHVAAMRMV